MHSIDDDPLRWAFEFAVCQTLVFGLQILVGFCTVLVARTPYSLSIKYAFMSCVILLVAYTAYLVFDSNTHLIGSMIAGLALAFVTPLQASAYLHDTHCCRQMKQQQPIHLTSMYHAILHIAIPASDPFRISKKPVQSSSTQFLNALFNLLCVSIYRYLVIFALKTHHHLFISITSIFFLYFGVATSLNFLSAFRGLLGLPSAAPFHSPFVSTSHTDFWAWRWNAPVSDALRAGIARPLIETFNVHPVVAVLACFLFSGLAHEFILWYGGVFQSKGEWFLFFLIAGVFTIVEKYVIQQQQRLKRNMQNQNDHVQNRIVAWLSVLFTLGPLYHFLFVPITLRTGLAQHGLDAFAAASKILNALYQYFG